MSRFALGVVLGSIGAYLAAVFFDVMIETIREQEQGMGWADAH